MGGQVEAKKVGILEKKNIHTAVLSLKKYVPALLSSMQIYKITLYLRDKFSLLPEAQSQKKYIYL